MAGGGDNQTLEIKKVVVNLDPATKTTPANKQFAVLGCGQYGNEQLELVSLDVVARVIPIDASDAITFDVNFVDDSNSDTETALVDDFSFKSTNATLVAKVVRNIWTGSQILDPGDAINCVFTSTSPDTAGEGTALIASYRVLRHS